MIRSVPALRLLLPLVAMTALTPPSPGAAQDAEPRPRARDLGMTVGIFEPGAENAITDVEGVLVGQTTRIEGTSIRTGVTAILPHSGDLYRSRVPAALFVGNGYGKLVGVTQLRELGELETPILLTCTLCVWRAADAMVEWMLEREGMEQVRSLNAVVGETNDGGLNDIRSRPVRPEDVRGALEGATAGAVEEGSVGAGTGTRAFGWKGGIGTSSRVLPEALGGHTVGVLVQSNYGGILAMDGAPVGEELGRYSFRGAVEGADRPASGARAPGGEGSSAGGATPWTDAPIDPDPDGGAGDYDHGQGSVMIVVATDAPLSDRNLERLAARAIMGLARTGSFAGNGSGDYVLAFATHPSVRRAPGAAAPQPEEIGNSGMSGLFQAAVEATEEAIYNSLLKATTVTGVGGRTAEALPIEATVEVLRRYGVIR